MADGQLVVQVSDRTYAPVSDAGNGQYYVSGEAFDPSVPRAPAAVTHAPTAVTQPPTQAPAATAPVAEPVRKARTKTAPADATPTDGAAKKGRPAGAKTRALSLEQQVYMSGVQATMANPVYGSVCNESTLQLSGQMALRAFQMQFGEE